MCFTSIQIALFVLIHKQAKPGTWVINNGIKFLNNTSFFQPLWSAFTTIRFNPVKPLQSSNEWLTTSRKTIAKKSTAISRIMEASKKYYLSEIVFIFASPKKC